MNSTPTEDGQEASAEPQPTKPEGIKKQLLFGLGFAALGVLMIGGHIGWILYHVYTKAGHIIISNKILGGGFVVLFMGLLYAICGKRALSVFDKMDQGLSQIKWYEWLILVGLGCAGLACYMLVIHYLETLGYKTDY